MPRSKLGFTVTILVTVLLLVVATGCVRAKPAREREPLPTLPPVEAAVVEGEQEAGLGEAEVVEEGESEEPVAEGTSVPSITPEPTAIPTPEPTLTPEPTPYTGALYTVMAGDTLGTIAEAHGSTVSAFMEANQLSAGATLRIGQQLRLPDGVEPLWETDVENTAIHIVKSGETLNDIAARYRMPAGQIMALNTWLKDPSLLRPGQELTVVVQPLDPNAVIHVVRAGESLASIALQYGVSLSALAEANYIVDTNRLAVGQELVIPQ
ncbi:MAG: LysM peptidoglycan-binding domain-containing protein [Anaerolineae bacterium]